MDDKQTSALILLFVLAFIMWLYNAPSNDGQTNKLRAVIAEIENPSQSNAGNSSGNTPAIPNNPITGIFQMLTGNAGVQSLANIISGGFNAAVSAAASAGASTATSSDGGNSVGGALAAAASSGG